MSNDTVTEPRSADTIAAQVAAFNPGFEGQIGPELSAVFADEQAGLNAAGVPEDAVMAGDAFPDLPLVAPDGRVVPLAEALGDGTAVVVFYRGAWCPYCDITLKTYQRDLLPALTDRGVRLVAVSPQSPESSARTAEASDLGFAVLGDPGAALIGSLGILTEPTAGAQEAHGRLGFDVADFNADASHGVPFPTALVVDASRTVRWADVHVDYTTRSEVADVLDAVDAVG